MPGFGALPDNSVTVLETNPSFVQSCLVGVNHEMSREFAWRDYPTSLNNTWFYSFWNYVDNGPQRDILPIKKWGDKVSLGSMKLSAQSLNSKEKAVLLIKGDLLKHYPKTKIYMVKAKWDLVDEAEYAEWKTINPQIKKPQIRLVRKLDTSSEKNVMLPVFKGEIQSQAHFLGFDITAEQAKGSANPDNRDAGWFFVFEENIKEPRFGLDVPSSFSPKSKPRDPNDLSWGNFASSQEELDKMGHLTLSPEWRNKKFNNNAEWGKNSADMANITYQMPVRVMFHADSLIE